MRRATNPERYEDINSATVLGITPARWAILSYLLDHPEGAGTRAISDALGLDSAAVRAQLRGMVKDGAVISTIDPYFPTRGQRPVYAANRDAIIDALHDISRRGGFTVIETANLQPGELNRTIARRLRNILKLIDQADGVD
ncbi:MAG: MarR family transcriptional regulator [Propionibacteriaceae bacterium]|nr:MarR family transcriptional regulator [Propionibacteriaceae bacterium]